MSQSRRNALSTLRHRNFRMLWIADTIAIMGTQILVVTMTWQVYDISRNPLQLGMLGLFRFVPVLFFGLYGGLIADRRDRRMILIVTHILMMGITSSLMIASIMDQMTIPLIYAVTFLASAVSAFAGPARQALVPSLVPREDVTGAATVLNLAMQTAQIGAPALGGLIIGAMGEATAYGVGSASFLAVIIAAYMMTVRDKIAAVPGSGVAAVIEGLRFLWMTPILLGVMSLDFIATLFAASTTLMPIFAEEVLEMGPDGLGLLLSAPAVGAVAGSLLMSVAPIPQRPGLGIVVAILAYGCCITAFGLSTVVWVSVLFLALSGAADAVSMAMRHSIRNLVTPPAYRGRIAAAHTTFARGGPQLGEIEAGVTASWFGAPAAVAFGGVATVVGCLVMAWLIPSLVRYRATPEPVHEDALTA